MTRRNPAIATRVSPNINKAVKQLTKTLGITVSEYLRKLILDDLESKRIFSNHFKKAIEQSEAEKPEESPEAKITKLLAEPEKAENNESLW